MPIHHKRWNDAKEPEDGFRVLICRYRPRALRKENETWELWWKELGPSRELHAEYYGKHGPPLSWGVYQQKYLDEMKDEKPQERIADLARRVAAGETITLLCSSACTDADHCHRTLLRQLIEDRIQKSAG